MTSSSIPQECSVYDLHKAVKKYCTNTIFGKYCERALYFEVRGLPFHEHPSTTAKILKCSQGTIDNIRWKLKKLGLINFEPLKGGHGYIKFAQLKFDKMVEFFGDAIQYFFGSEGVNTNKRASEKFSKKRDLEKPEQTKPNICLYKHCFLYHKNDNSSTFDKYFRYLNQAHGINNKYSIEEQLKIIVELHNKGYDIIKCMNNAICNGWKQCYPYKATRFFGFGNSKPHPKAETPFERCRRTIQEKRQRQRERKNE